MKGTADWCPVGYTWNMHVELSLHMCNGDTAAAACRILPPPRPSPPTARRGRQAAASMAGLSAVHGEPTQGVPGGGPTHEDSDCVFYL